VLIQIRERATPLARRFKAAETTILPMNFIEENELAVEPTVTSRFVGDGSKKLLCFRRKSFLTKVVSFRAKPM